MCLRIGFCSSKSIKHTLSRLTLNQKNAANPIIEKVAFDKNFHNLMHKDDGLLHL